MVMVKIEIKMSKFVIFNPENYIDEEEPDNDILWKVDYKLHSEGFSANVYFFDAIQKEITDTFPLEVLEQNMMELGMEKVFDFPYAKEYVFEDEFGILFSAVIRALDLHSYENKVKINKKFADILFEDLDLPFNGSMHPEKFLRKIASSIDFSDKKYESYDKNFNILLELENLCDRCLQYESNIEWKLIDEVIK